MPLLADFHPKGEVPRAYGAYRRSGARQPLARPGGRGGRRALVLSRPGRRDPRRQPDLRRARQPERSSRTRAVTTHQRRGASGRRRRPRHRGGPGGDPLPGPRLPRTAPHLGRGRASFRCRLCFRHFPMASKHPRAPALHAAAEAAGAQGAFWEMCDSLFADRGRVDDPHLWERAERFGLDLDRFNADRRSAAVEERVRRDFESGSAAASPAPRPLGSAASSLTAGVEDELAALPRLGAASGRSRSQPRTRVAPVGLGACRRPRPQRTMSRLRSLARILSGRPAPQRVASLGRPRVRSPPRWPLRQSRAALVRPGGRVRRRRAGGRAPRSRRRTSAPRVPRFVSRSPSAGVLAARTAVVGDDS